MPENEAFQPGDVVVLKSGGPLMTVSSIDRDGDLNCVWFIEAERKFAEFKAPSVKRADSDTVLRGGSGTSKTRGY